MNAPEENNDLYTEGKDLYDHSMSEEEFERTLQNAFDGDVSENDSDEDHGDEASAVDGDEETEASAEEEDRDSDTEAQKIPEEPKPEPEKMPTSKPEKDERDKEISKYQKMLRDLKDVAKNNFFDSIEEMIADNLGISVDEYKKQLDVEEEPKKEEPVKDTDTKAALAQKVAAEAKLWKVVDPDTKATTLDDLKDKQKYMNLVDAGMEPGDAYLYVQGIKPKSPVSDSGKSHMTASAPAKKISGGVDPVPSYVSKAMREMYPGITDKEIADLYKKTK